MWFGVLVDNVSTMRPGDTVLRRNLLNDIFNDFHDVTERKTGSLLCRLAMAISDSQLLASFFISSVLKYHPGAQGTAIFWIHMASMLLRSSCCERWHARGVWIATARSPRRFGSRGDILPCSNTNPYFGRAKS